MEGKATGKEESSEAMKKMQGKEEQREARERER